jgi:hypothetical protein
MQRLLRLQEDIPQGDPLAPSRAPERGRWREELCRLVLQEQLIETRPSLQALDRSRGLAAPGAVFLGIGLCTDSSASTDLPLDVLGVLLPAERLRRALGLDRLLVLVADEHALENSDDAWYRRQIQRRARQVCWTLERIRAPLGLQGMQILLASDLQQVAGYRRELAEVRRRAPADEHPYFKREVADIAFLDRLHGGILKVGWTISASDRALHCQDELAFDRRYRRWMDHPVYTVYCKAGRAFDDRRPKASPYVTTDASRRICLRPDEQVVPKLRRAQDLASGSTIRGTRRHLNAICRAHGELTGPLAGVLEQRVQRLIELAFGGHEPRRLGYRRRTSRRPGTGGWSAV